MSDSPVNTTTTNPGTITKADGGGLRYNDGKIPFQYFAPEALLELGKHYQRGNAKYEPRNWERGMDWSICFDSLQRHAWAWLGGEDRDPETGSLHMTAVAWNAIALIVYSIRGIGKDDRPK